MSRIRLVPALLGIGSLSLSACDLPQLAGQSSPPSSSRQPTRTTPARSVSPVPARASSASSRPEATTLGQSSSATPKDGDGGKPVNLIGLDEQQLRRLLGPPAAEEDHPPGKVWRYRKGGCSLNLSLYPDVQTRKFGTLTYEVRSDDNTDEGKRACLADIQPRGQTK
jgi:hypothetical protein